MMAPQRLKTGETLEEAIRAVIREVPDCPRPGILFRDITSLLARPALFVRCTDEIAKRFADAGVTHVVAIESRGFIFGAPVAQTLGLPLVPVRKPGKLPCRTERVEYALEYGTDALEVHADACGHGARVLVVDDVLATGGTARATGALMTSVGATTAGYAFLLELAALDGRRALTAQRVEALATV